MNYRIHTAKVVAGHTNTMRVVLGATLISIAFVSGCGRCKRDAQPQQQMVVPACADALTNQNVQAFFAKWYSSPEGRSSSDVLPMELVAIKSLGKDCIPYILSQMTSDVPGIRVAAHYAIVCISNKRFGDSDPFWQNDLLSQEARRTAILAWEKWWAANQSRTRTEWLIDDIASTNQWQKEDAIRELGDLHDPSAIQPLRNAISDSSVTHYVVGALARLGDPDTIPHVMDLYIEKGDWIQQKQGCEYLSQLTGLRPDTTNLSTQVEFWEEWWAQKRASGGLGIRPCNLQSSEGDEK